MFESLETLTSRELASLLKISTRTLRRHVREHFVPAPVWISPGCVRFLRRDVEEWLRREKLASKHSPDRRAGEIEEVSHNALPDDHVDLGEVEQHHLDQHPDRAELLA